ncbi:hypothetical protein D6783_02435 [Candidatus Woesearchaeota archaeon]|nr:MAG: hypothetical protein D6783_02435 [Candidatus Woesearchaeota archaeon]
MRGITNLKKRAGWLQVEQANCQNCGQMLEQFARKVRIFAKKCAKTVDGVEKITTMSWGHGLLSFYCLNG